MIYLTLPYLTLPLVMPHSIQFPQGFLGPKTINMQVSHGLERLTFNFAPSSFLMANLENVG